MTHITLKNENSFSARLIIAFARLFGSETAAIDTDAVRYTPEILAAVARERSGNREGDITFKTPEEMYKHFGYNPEADI